MPDASATPTPQGPLARVRAALRGRRRAVEPVSQPSPELVAEPVPAPVERRATLRDQQHQDAFERDGFVIVDLLDDHEVAALRACYDAMEHQVQSESPWVAGFETSLYDGRADYRRQVLDDVEGVMAPAFDRLLADHRIMFANYVVKLPHADEVPLHADWTFLDEDRFSSATVWCPLTDTSPELRNGPLGMVVRSQERIDFLRIANIPSYDECVDAVADLPRSVPSLRAGQAVVMDNRVVHFSLPNETDDVRVAVGCVVGPTEADLHHYWLDHDADRLLRFQLDRSFYLSYEIGQPIGTEGILAVDEVPYEPAAS